MKLHWGYGIAIVYTAFVGMMLFFVFKSRGVDHSLVATDYYAKDLAYQSHFEKLEHTQSLPSKPNISFDHEARQLLVRFPEHLAGSAGQVQLFKPDQAEADFSVAFAAGQSEVRIDLSDKARGLWKVQIDWTHANVPYFLEQTITH